MYTDPVTLTCRTVRLEPMRPEHAGALLNALEADEEIWRYLPTEMPRDLSEMQVWMDTAFEELRLGQRLQFVVVELASGKVIGSTSYCHIAEQHQNLEIGYTWYNRAYWRTAVNTECKYLLLKHAFEALGCIRVQLRTDERNERSRRAIERIGGVLEGVIRKDRLVKGGFHRSSAQYSILAEEWPARKAWFEERMSA